MIDGLIGAGARRRREGIRAARRVVTVCLPAVLLTACATMPDTAPTALALLPPASLGASHSVEQVLHAAHGAREATLQCIVEVVPERMRVICLTALGQRAFTLEQTADGLRAERAPFTPDEMQPERILADIQLAYWPLPALQAAASPDVQVVEPRAGLRRLQRGARIVAEVHHAGGDPWNGRLWLVNFDHGYSLDIRSRALTEAAR